MTNIADVAAADTDMIITTIMNAAVDTDMIIITIMNADADTITDTIMNIMKDVAVDVADTKCLMKMWQF